MTGRVSIPPTMLAYAQRGPSWADWLDALPRSVDDVLDEWELTVDGPPWHGFCALVVPVVRADGVPAVAKFSWMLRERKFEVRSRRNAGPGTSKPDPRGGVTRQRAPWIGVSDIVSHARHRRS